jgi:SAM-dependent methyltransferase
MIFSHTRKLARRSRAEAIYNRYDSEIFLIEHMVDDVFERLSFMKHEGYNVLIDGFGDHLVAELPWDHPASFHYVEEQDLDQPSRHISGTFDLVASVGTLDKLNDLPGALIQMRELLAPGGVVIASFVGGASLPKLRRAMFEAEPERPAARMHPLVDPRSCPQLLGRAGWKDPVVDSHTLTVRYGSLDRLVQDLRVHAMGSVLASPAPPLTRAARERARAAFLAQADEDGKVSETFEIITLTGRR